MRIELSLHVVDFMRRLAPEPRSLLRRSLKELAKGKGDIVALEGPLEGYCRLRVGGFRIIFAYSGRRSVQCVFAERRSIVYEVFAQALADKLTGVDE